MAVDTFFRKEKGEEFDLLVLDVRGRGGTTHIHIFGGGRKAQDDPRYEFSTIFISANPCFMTISMATLYWERWQMDFSLPLVGK